MTFPSQNASYGGTSTNLINIGAGEGNVLMISENNQSPYQGQTLNSMTNSASGGTVSFQFAGLAKITSLKLIGQLSAGTAVAYEDLAGTITIGTLNFGVVGNGVVTSYAISNMDKARRFDVTFGGKGGIASVTYTACSVCPTGVFPDCAGVCGGPSILDCNKTCFNPVVSETPHLCDCNGTCYETDAPPPHIPDCAGTCYDVDTIPPHVPDCNGVCDGNSVADCNGVCDGTATPGCDGECGHETCAKLRASLKMKEKSHVGKKISKRITNRPPPAGKKSELHVEENVKLTIRRKKRN
jgi:hypothetical protein